MVRRIILGLIVLGAQSMMADPGSKTRLLAQSNQTVQKLTNAQLEEEYRKKRVNRRIKCLAENLVVHLLHEVALEFKSPEDKSADFDERLSFESMTFGDR